jgi:hypothetical protein
MLKKNNLLYLLSKLLSSTETMADSENCVLTCKALGLGFSLFFGLGFGLPFLALALALAKGQGLTSLLYLLLC